MNIPINTELTTFQERLHNYLVQTGDCLLYNKSRSRPSSDIRLPFDSTIRYLHGLNELSGNLVSLDRRLRPDWISKAELNLPELPELDHLVRLNCLGRNYKKSIQESINRIENIDRIQPGTSIEQRRKNAQNAYVRLDEITSMGCVSADELVDLNLEVERTLGGWLYNCYARPY